jgi:hypothetical protein
VDEIIGEFIGAFVRGILGENLHPWMIVRTTAGVAGDDDLVHEPMFASPS